MVALVGLQDGATPTRHLLLRRQTIKFMFYLHLARTRGHSATARSREARRRGDSMNRGTACLANRPQRARSMESPVRRPADDASDPARRSPKAAFGVPASLCPIFFFAEPDCDRLVVFAIDSNQLSHVNLT